MAPFFRIWHGRENTWHICIQTGRWSQKSKKPIHLNDYDGNGEARSTETMPKTNRQQHNDTSSRR